MRKSQISRPTEIVGESGDASLQDVTNLSNASCSRLVSSVDWCVGAVMAVKAAEEEHETRKRQSCPPKTESMGHEISKDEPAVMDDRHREA